MIWCWRKGNKCIYTSSFNVAEQALKQGFQVEVLKSRSNIFRH